MHSNPKIAQLTVINNKFIECVMIFLVNMLSKVQYIVSAPTSMTDTSEIKDAIRTILQSCMVA